MSTPFDEILGAQPVVAILHTDGEGRSLRVHATDGLDTTVAVECVDTVAAALGTLGVTMGLGELRGGVISFANGHVALGRLGRHETVGIVAGEDAKIGILLHQLRELVAALEGA